MSEPPASAADAASVLRPYVAGLALDWLRTSPRARHQRIEGSLAFVDISGFTTLTERLAAKGKVGAEEMSDLLDAAFARLLEEAYAYGASLVKWGGDAVLLLFEGPEHALLACRAAHEMRATMRRIGRLRTSVGVVQLKMSVGIDSGSFDFFLVGRRHHELLVAGPAATTTAVMEQTADAGEIVVSATTAAQLPARLLGAPKGEGVLLRAGPDVAPRSRCWILDGHEGAAGDCLDAAIREHLLTEVGEGEHRQVAVGFVEVSGVDDVLLQQGPGATAGALHDLLVLVQEACARHRVTFWETDISKDGFKVMLVCGAPRSTGRDEEGMLRATRAILDGHHGPVRLRIGVNCGRVFSGGFGPPFRRTWSVKGDAVNLAARVMGKAGDGQLLATQGLLDRVGRDVDAQLLPPFLVKGKQQRVVAGVVRSVAGAGAGAAAGRPASGAPFVGREALVTELHRLGQAATAGRGTTVLITGAPGIGKSRLLEQVCARLPASTVVHRACADDYESATPYFVLGQLLRSALAVDAEAPDDAVLGALHARLAADAPHLVPWLPLLASALGATVADTAETAAVQDRFRRERVVTLAVELLALLNGAATLFVVEDVHSADEVSVEVLARVASASPQRPWLVALVGRHAPAGLAGAAAVDRVTVPPLSDHESRALVIAGGGEGLAPHLVQALVLRAEGNPLFLTELTAAAANDGDDLPSTLEELLAAQVDDLAPKPRQVLRVASVLGTRFEESVLTDLLGTPVEAPTWRDLDHFVVTDGQGTRRFHTRLVRDAAYEGLPFRRRVELHGRAATALEARAVTGPSDLAEALSQHCLAAQRFDDAWRYALLAGRRAQQVYANTEALTFYRRARAAARRLPDLPAVEVAALLEAVGDVHARLAELEPATQAYRAARREAPRTERLLRARVALSAGLVAERAGALDRATRWLSIAHRDATGDGGAEDGRLAELDARITVERAYLRHTVGREAAASALCRQALDQAERAGTVPVEARALLLLDEIDLWAGKPGDEERVLRALRLFEQCGDLPRQGGVWNHLGMRAYFRGEWDLAVDCYRRAEGAHERSADEWSAAIARANIGEILVDQGRLDEAEPLVTEALRVWRVSGTPSDIGFGAALLGRLKGRRGRTHEALALLGEAAACYAGKDERAELVDVALSLAEALLLQGAADDAMRHLQEAEDRLRAARRAAGLTTTEGDDLPPTTAAVALLRLRGCAAVQLGRAVAAHELLARSVALARQLGTTHELARSLRAQAWAEDGSAAARSQEAAELFARLGVVWSPELPREARQPATTEVAGQRSAAAALL